MSFSPFAFCSFFSSSPPYTVELVATLEHHGPLADVRAGSSCRRLAAWNGQQIPIRSASWSLSAWLARMPSSLSSSPNSVKTWGVIDCEERSSKPRGSGSPRQFPWNFPLHSCVLPLVLAEGAAKNAPVTRHGGVSGTPGVTFFGLVLTPVFVSRPEFRKFASKKKPSVAPPVGEPQISPS